MRGIGLSREKVIAEAGALANEQGLRAVTITNLAKYLGIKKPSLYNHIKDQEDILNEIMIYGWKQISDEICPRIITEDAKEKIINSGYDPIYGARPMKRYLQASIETLLAKAILSRELNIGSTLTVDLDDSGELFVK